MNQDTCNIPVHVLELHNLFVKNFQKKNILNYQNVKKIFNSTSFEDTKPIGEEDHLDLNAITPTLKNYLINIKESYIAELVHYYMINDNNFISFQDFYSICNNVNYWNEKIDQKLQRHPEYYIASSLKDDGEPRDRTNSNERKKRSILKHTDSFRGENNEDGAAHHISAHHVSFDSNDTPVSPSHDIHKEVHFLKPSGGSATSAVSPYHASTTTAISKYYLKEVPHKEAYTKRFPIETVEDFMHRHGFTASLMKAIDSLLVEWNTVWNMNPHPDPKHPEHGRHHQKMIPVNLHWHDYELHLLKRGDNVFRLTFDFDSTSNLVNHREEQNKPPRPTHMICLLSKETPVPLEEEEDKLF
jgi:hypothetical protein